MDGHTILYNSLPLVHEARKTLSTNMSIIPQLFPLLEQHHGKFGVCLVHRHCTLLNEERMVADGPVTEPLITDQCHPASWLKSGEPFEFSMQPTECPPESLFFAFRQIVGELDVLGIYYIPEEDRTTFRFGIEHTRGRRNIMRYEDSLTTAWCLYGGNIMIGPHNLCQLSEHKPHCCPPYCPPHGYQRSTEQSLGSIYVDELVPALSVLNAKTSFTMQSCASLLPPLCKLAMQHGCCWIRWTNDKVDIPANTAYVTETRDLLDSLIRLSKETGDLYECSLDLSSTFKKRSGLKVFLRGAEESTVTSQLTILNAQLVLLSQQVSTLSGQLASLPTVDPVVTRLRDWSKLFSEVSNQVDVLDETVKNVSKNTSGLVDTLNEFRCVVECLLVV
jgi:hypothetical protein